MAKFRNSFESLEATYSRWSVDFDTHERWIRNYDITYFEGGRRHVTCNFTNNPSARYDVSNEAGLLTGLVNELPEIILASGEAVPKAWLADNYPFIGDREHNRIYNASRYRATLKYAHNDAVPVPERCDKFVVNRPDMKRIRVVLKELEPKRMAAVAAVRLSGLGRRHRVTFTDEAALFSEWPDDVYDAVGSLSDEDWRGLVRQAYTTEEKHDYLLVDRRYLK